jgi:hypothetical protein
MSEVIQSELAKALPGAILGLIPITLTAFFEWQEKRDVADRRNQAIDIAHKRVNFLNDLIKTQECCATDQLHSIKQDISNELKQLKQELSENLLTLDQRTIHRSGTHAQRSLLQNLFLAYFPRSTVAWALHVIYYMLLGITILILFGGGYSSANPHVWDWAEFRLSLIGAIALIIPPMALIQWLSRAADKRSRRIARETQQHLDSYRTGRSTNLSHDVS